MMRTCWRLRKRRSVSARVSSLSQAATSSLSASRSSPASSDRSSQPSSASCSSICGSRLTCSLTKSLAAQTRANASPCSASQARHRAASASDRLPAAARNDSSARLTKGRSEGGNATSDGRLIEVSFTTANTMDRAIQSLASTFYREMPVPLICSFTTKEYFRGLIPAPFCSKTTDARPYPRHSSKNITRTGPQSR